MSLFLYKSWFSTFSLSICQRIHFTDVLIKCKIFLIKIYIFFCIFFFVCLQYILINFSFLCNTENINPCLVSKVSTISNLLHTFTAPMDDSSLLLAFFHFCFFLSFQQNNKPFSSLYMVLMTVFSCFLLLFFLGGWPVGVIN